MDKHDPEQVDENQDLPESEEPTTQPDPEVVSETPVESDDTLDEPDNVETDYVPDQPRVNYKESLAVTSELKQAEALDNMLSIVRESVSTLNTVLTQHDALLERLNRQDEATRKAHNKAGTTMGDDEGSPWLRTLTSAMAALQLDERGVASLSRDDAEWDQVMDYEGTSIRAGQPKQRLGTGKHSNEEILSYIARKSGSGTVFDVPLYHSGVWLRFKTPPLSALTSLQYQLNQIKVTLGTDTKGMAFSGTSQALAGAAIDFALQYVVEANVHYSTPSDLKSVITQLDQPMVLWGLACTLFPKGFPYAHPCVADPQNCNHITKELLNLTRLFWVDTVSLTQTQKKLMARRFNVKMSEDDLALYRTERVRGNDRVVWFDDIGLTLKVPTLQEYEDAGTAWINGIVEMTQGAFNEPPHGSNRDQYISRLGWATTARQYTHWVSAVHERDEEGEAQLISDDQEVIDNILVQVFSDDQYVNDFFNAVAKFTDDSILSMVAIPSFNCPECKSPAAKRFHERFDHLVPLDVLTTFFMLVNLKHS